MEEKISDGWKGQSINQFIRDYETLESYIYEVRNCIRGCNTGATTKRELADVLREQVECLMEDIDQIEQEED